jgi:hypothetical protein
MKSQRQKLSEISYGHKDQQKESINEVSAECLTTCLQTLGIAHDIICDSQISLFSHTFLHGPPPRQALATLQCQSRNARSSNVIATDPPIYWHIVVDSVTSKKITTLTPCGKEWFSNFSSISEETRKVTSSLPSNYFTSQYFELIIDPNHSLCENSLTILRRCYGLFILRINYLSPQI